MVFGPTPARLDARALEGVRVIGCAQRLEVADQEPDDLIACGGAPAPHLVDKAERAQGLLERTAEGRRAAEHDRDVGQAQLGPLRAKALDLAGAGEGLVDRVTLTGHADRATTFFRREEMARREAGVRALEQSLARF